MKVNKSLLKDLMSLKLKIVDEIIDLTPLGDNIKSMYGDFIEVVNMATDEYIQERSAKPKAKREQSMKNIHID